MAKFTTTIIFSLFLFVSSFANAVNVNPVSIPVDGKQVNPVPKLAFLKNFEGSNQVKLLNNRFRVDYEVDELLMLFFRKHGSKPIVLVRPDGSKLYTRDADGINLEWHADVNFDLIRIKNPIAGPWQALGMIEKDSKVLVLSEVELIVDKLPDLIFQYEVLKAEAKIVNAQEIISESGFRSVVRVRSALYSTNDLDQENFGADLYRLGEFFDDGKGLDEKPNDGVFTLSYYIDVVTGTWMPKYTLEAELFGREIEHEPITVLPSPISYKVKLAGPNERYHYVTIEADPMYIEADKLMFQGLIEFPNGETQTFSLSEQHIRELEIFQSEFGTFKITTEVFGNDLSGRDFKLKLPVYEIVTTGPEIEAEILPEMSQEQLLSEKAVEVVPVEVEPELSIGLVILINLIILVIGFIIIWVVVLNKAFPNPMNLIKLIKLKKSGGDKSAGKKENKEKVDKNSLDLDSSDDILDLSLPED
ncbi:TIGR03503 family protein [Psychrosphaera sp. B3R10]|uniref:TIGR03503 family protein n=1 Tax=unclassified Psychrosphaera TaxID=2641570 RepID=UPI001C07FF48|nr:TIGR03503 family protein [Psychrosphaera sp. I2R16]MBU2988112.1 TIGR03503 family protein [Psychrosphaera sp. B3R10]